MSKYFKKTVIILALCVLRMNLNAQEMETARSIAYDRGLIDAAEPYASSGNPALLCLKNDFRFHFEWHAAASQFYTVSIAYPLSYSTGLGIAWFSSRLHEVQSLSAGLFEVNQNRQKFMLSLGHNKWLQWGQQFEVDVELNRFSTITSLDPAIIPFTNDQRLQLTYRLGVCKALLKNITVAVLSSPILNLKYHTGIDDVNSSESQIHIWRESNTHTDAPLFALQWKPVSDLGFVFTNRSRAGDLNMQLASELKWNRFSFTGAVQHEPDQKGCRWITGLSLYLKGFDIFSAFDFKDKGFRIAVSFAPERSRDLIQMELEETLPIVIYPYRLRQGDPESAVKIGIKNISAASVEVNMTLSGSRLPTLSKRVHLENSGVTSITFPIPHELMFYPPAKYQYHYQITAYHRGKQMIEGQIPFELKDSHEWAGDPRDLIYFVTPEEEDIIAEARRMIMTRLNTNNPLNAVDIANIFYTHIRDSIRYLRDPKPLHRKQDRVQYPLETLRLQSGDCEDLSVLMITLLQSVGIDAAFVEFTHPESEEGHVFMIFDSQISGAQMSSEDQNMQKFLFRYENEEKSKYYIPLELTNSENTFESAWENGLQTYQKFGIDQRGLVEQWFRIIDPN